MVRRLGAPPAPRVRTVKRCSLDVRSEEHHSHPPPSVRGGKNEKNEELTSTARGTRTIKQCSFDTRSEGHSASCPLVLEQFKEAVLCRSA